MTAEEAVALIEREARAASVDLPGLAFKRDLIVAGLEHTPATIPFFLQQAREEIAARRVIKGSGLNLE